jgi:putative phosphoribosyl transferase
LDNFMISSLKISKESIEQEKKLQMLEIENRTKLFRPVPRDYDIAGRIVVLIDDGIATGSTLIAAARWIRKQNSSQLIIAAPVAPPQAVKLLEGEADAVEILSTPSNFVTVNQFYQDFDQAIDERVLEILRIRNLLL